jgi:hypothetical protein
VGTEVNWNSGIPVSSAEHEGQLKASFFILSRDMRLDGNPTTF